MKFPEFAETGAGWDFSYNEGAATGRKPAQAELERGTLKSK
jgi:hypothetical protein